MPITVAVGPVYLSSKLGPSGAADSTIQKGHKKCLTHARVFSKALLNWNSNNKIRQRNGGKK